MAHLSLNCGAESETTAKQPFDIDSALKRIRPAIASWPRAALFELHAAGYKSAFELLVACILSIRTRDETTLPTALKLFDVARTPAAVAALGAETLDELIRASAFHAGKAANILAIAERAILEFDGVLPCDFDVLVSMPGVGPKCANLVLGIACEVPSIGVDIHVHRVTNRWGYIDTRTPEGTLQALSRTLPRRYWVTINELLVPFGKHICTGARPFCSTCPVLTMCAQRGVTAHR